MIGTTITAMMLTQPTNFVVEEKSVFVAPNETYSWKISPPVMFIEPSGKSPRQLRREGMKKKRIKWKKLY